MNNNQELFIIATPIGNIKEVSNLAIQTFESLQCILCEDTRTTKNLLSQLNIDYSDKYFVSYHKFNEHEKLDYVLELFEKYQSIGLVSDAGYPIINDPGYNLIASCYEHNIKVSVVNGPCAAIHALVVSGIPSNTFMYLGFLERTKTKRLKQLKQYQAINTTFIIYESVHRLVDTLKDLYEIFGNILVSVGRELSKLHETVYRFPLKDLIENLDVINLKGEFVIIVDNNNPLINSETIDWTQDELLNDKTIKPKEKAKLIANKYQLKTADVYHFLVSKNEEK